MSGDVNFGDMTYGTPSKVRFIFLVRKGHQDMNRDTTGFEG